MKFTRSQNEKSFECLKHICEKLCSISKEDEFVKQLIYDKMFADIRIYSSAPNVLGKKKTVWVIPPTQFPYLRNHEHLFSELSCPTNCTRASTNTTTKFEIGKLQRRIVSPTSLDSTRKVYYLKNFDRGVPVHEIQVHRRSNI